MFLLRQFYTQHEKENVGLFQTIEEIHDYLHKWRSFSFNDFVKEYELEKEGYELEEMYQLWYEELKVEVLEV